MCRNFTDFRNLFALNAMVLKGILLCVFIGSSGNVQVDSLTVLKTEVMSYNFKYKQLFI